MRKDDLDDLVDALFMLNESELIFVLNNLFERVRGKKKILSDDERYFFGISVFNPDCDDSPYFEYFANPADIDPCICGEEVGLPSRGASETGMCPKCNTIVACFEKKAVCPVCGFDGVECT